MIKGKTIVAVVPARGASKGIKLKNLKKINGKSLIEITSNFIDKIKVFDKKVLNSENNKILNLGKKLNFFNIKRPKDLSGDYISDYELLKYTITIFKKLKINADYIVYLQPTSPIRQTKHLLKAIKIVIDKNLDGAWSVSKIDKKFHPLKILIKKNNFLKLFNNSGKKVVARQMLSDAYIRNGVFYIFSVNQLKKQKTIYLKKTLLIDTNYKTVNIDSYKDLNYSKLLLKKINQI